jgi:hypothetical protein
METTKQNKFKVLHGYDSMENAFIIDNYPWGFKLKTKQKIWLEYKPNKGYRVARQTLNPKNGRWCNPKRSTYSEFLALVENQENNHVNSIGVSSWDLDKMKEFKAKWQDQFKPEQLTHLDSMIELKEAYSKAFDRARKEASEIVKIDNSTLEENTLYPKSTITKLKENQELLKFYIYASGVKKRCRKSERHFIYLGYFLPTEQNRLLFANDMLAKYIGKIQESVNNYFRSYDSNIQLCVKKTTFKAPEGDSPFYGMQEMLMDREEIKIPLYEYLNGN